MKYKVNIVKDNIINFSGVLVSYNEYNDTIEIYLNICDNSDISNLLNKEEIIKKTIECISDIKLIKKIKLLNKLKKIDNNFLSKSDIYINFFEGIGEFIKNNKCLQDKTIYLEGTFKNTSEDINKILKELDGINNIKVKLEGNRDYVYITDYIKTYESIESISNKIKKYNLSPLEQIMFAYDLVRDRVYKAESKDESSNESRDLTSVLLGDKIICSGFANIFEKVLNSLGIKNNSYELLPINGKIGHKRNMIYIKDEKYNIEGIYYFDPTWDSKKDINDNKFYNYYKYFCLSKDFIKKYDDKYKIIDTLYNGYTRTLCYEFAKIVKEKGIENIPKDMVLIFNRISNFIDGKNVLNPKLYDDDCDISIYKSFNLENTMKDLERYTKLLFPSPITPDKFIELIYNVRKAEYLENPEKYPFSIEDIKKASLSNPQVNELIFMLDKHDENGIIDKYKLNVGYIEEDIKKVKVPKR